ncbi:hypothetical protein J1605_020813 [Eschrichtius robustus]|uniref:Uncharacterized protein n=1 Tax=Eschrichtius robustus TaxID=9764 RepID=A0AB34HIV7_ESCRO|nr:hypothetical protein J1605_020813 [Eschrichtius robustus]
MRGLSVPADPSSPATAHTALRRSSLADRECAEASTAAERDREPFESSDEEDDLRAHKGPRAAADTLTKRPHVENSLSPVDAAA